MLKRLVIVITVNIILVGAIVFVTRNYQPYSDQPKLQSHQDTKVTQPSPAKDQSPGNNKNDRQPESPWWYIFVTWPAGITTWAVILTLEGIVWQSVEMRIATQQMSRSAKAAEDNVQVFIAAQSPQIIVTAHGNPPSDLLSATPRVQMELSNRGPTTALGLIYESWVEILPFPFVDFTTDADYHISTEAVSVYPGQRPVILNIPLRSDLTETERHELRKLMKFACIRIKASYRDSFSKTRRWVSFGYWVQSNGLGFLDKYNDSGEEENPN